MFESESFGPGGFIAFIATRHSDPIDLQDPRYTYTCSRVIITSTLLHTYHVMHVSVLTVP